MQQVTPSQELRPKLVPSLAPELQAEML